MVPIRLVLIPKTSFSFLVKFALLRLHENSLSIVNYCIQSVTSTILSIQV